MLEWNEVVWKNDVKFFKKIKIVYERKILKFILADKHQNDSYPVKYARIKIDLLISYKNIGNVLNYLREPFLLKIYDNWNLTDFATKSDMPKLKVKKDLSFFYFSSPCQQEHMLRNYEAMEMIWSLKISSSKST